MYYEKKRIFLCHKSVHTYKYWIISILPLYKVTNRQTGANLKSMSSNFWVNDKLMYLSL